MVVVLILKIWVWFWPASCHYITFLLSLSIMSCPLSTIFINTNCQKHKKWLTDKRAVFVYTVDAEELKRREIESVLATENSRLREELHRLRNLPPPVIVQQPVQVNLRPPLVTPQISCMNNTLYFINASDVRPISLSQTVRSWSYWHSWREPRVESRHWNNRFDL